MHKVPILTVHDIGMKYRYPAVFWFFFFPKKKLTNFFGTFEKVFLFFLCESGAFFFTFESHLSPFFFFGELYHSPVTGLIPKRGKTKSVSVSFPILWYSIIRHTHNRSILPMCITISLNLQKSCVKVHCGKPAGGGGNFCSCLQISNDVRCGRLAGFRRTAGGGRRRKPSVFC